MTASLLCGWRGTSNDQIPSGGTGFFRPTDVESDSGFEGIVIPAAGTISGLWFQVAAVPSGGGNSTFSIRKNDLTDEISVDFTTAELHKSVGSFAVAAGDTVHPKLVSGGTADNVEVEWFFFKFTPTDSSKTYTYLSTNSAGSTSISANGTNWLHVAGNRDLQFSSESDARFKCPIAGTLMDFQIYIANVTGTGDHTWTLLVNGTAPGSGPVITADETDAGSLVSDTTNTATIDAGDDLSVEWVSSNMSGTLNIEFVGIWLETTNNQFLLTSARIRGGATNMTFPSTAYMGAGGVMLNLADATSAQAQMEVPLAFDLKELHAYSDRAVSLSDSHTVTAQKDGVDTAAVVTFGAAETGWDSSTGHTISYAAGNTISFEFDMPGTGTRRDWNAVVAVCESAPSGGGGGSTPPSQNLRRRRMEFSGVLDVVIEDL